MILEMIILLNALTFLLLALGYWLKSKVIMFGGTTIMLILAAVLMFPDVYNGGIDYRVGSTEFSHQNATNVTVSETITNITSTETYTYTSVHSSVSLLTGLTLLLLALYLMYSIWAEEELE